MIDDDLTNSNNQNDQSNDQIIISDQSQSTTSNHKSKPKNGKPKKLTTKQQLFIDEYLIDFNATQAAIRAGYKPDSAKVIGHENLTKPDVQSELVKSMQNRSDNAKLTKEELIGNLLEIRDRCMQAEPVRDRKGRETGMWVFDSKGAIRSVELLGKHLGMFTGGQDGLSVVIELVLDCAGQVDSEMRAQFKMLLQQRIGDM